MSEVKNTRISQSLMKAVRAYLDGDGCGEVLREQYINGRLLEITSKAMSHGAYFEYILTGALPKNQQIPQPEYMKTPINANIKAGRPPLFGLKVDDMVDAYRKIHAKKVKVLQYITDMGFKIATDKDGRLLVGRKIVKGRFEGTLDLILEAVREVKLTSGVTLAVGDRVVVDIKYSGMIDDKWSVHGWQWVPIQKRYHGTQAKQYHYLADLPFFFLVVGAGDSDDIKFFHMVMDKDVIERHISEGNMLYERLVALHEDDVLTPRPEFGKCIECPLYDECKHKHTYPHPQTVDLTVD
jgi:hypothetical protein